MDYYSLIIRPVQFLAALPITLGLPGEAVIKFWIWFSFAASASFAYYFALSLLKRTISITTETHDHVIRLTAFAAGWLFAFNPLRFNFLLSGEFFSFQIVYMLYPLTLASVQNVVTGTRKNASYIAPLLLWITSANLQLFVLMLLVIIGFMLGSWRRVISSQSLLKTLTLTVTLFIGAILIFSYVSPTLKDVTRLQTPPTSQVIGHRPYVADWQLALIMAGYSYEFFTDSLGIFSAPWVMISLLVFGALAGVGLAHSKKDSSVSLLLIIVFATIGSGTLAPFPLSILSSTVYSIPIIALLFQTPVYWMFPIPLLATVVFTHASYRIAKTISKRKSFAGISFHRGHPLRILGIILIALSLSAWGYPLFIGSYTNYLDVYRNDPLLDSFQKQIASDPAYYRVLYVPTESVVRFNTTPYQRGGQTGGDPVLMTSPKPGLDLDLRSSPWADQTTKNIVHAYASEDSDLFDSLLQKTGTKFVVVNRGVDSLTGTNITRADLWFRTLSYLMPLNEDGYISIFQFAHFSSNYAFPASVPIELQTMQTRVGSTVLALTTGSPVIGWLPHIFGSGSFGQPSVMQNSSWALFSSTPGNSSGWDVYHRFQQPQAWSNASGIMLDLYGSGSGIMLTLVLQGLVNGTSWTASYDLFDLQSGVSTVIVPFSSFENSAAISNENLTLVDLIVPNPSRDITIGIGNFSPIISPPDTREQSQPVSQLTQLSPSEFTIRVENASGPMIIVLPESYSPLWKAYLLTNQSGSRFPLGDDLHFLAFGYANAWLILGVGNYTVVATFSAQSVWVQGLTISFVSFAILGATFEFGFRFYRKNRGHRSNTPRGLGKISPDSESPQTS